MVFDYPYPCQYVHLKQTLQWFYVVVSILSLLDFFLNNLDKERK